MSAANPNIEPRNREERLGALRSLNTALQLAGARRVTENQAPDVEAA